MEGENKKQTQKAIENDATLVEGTKYIWNFDQSKKGTFHLKFKKNKRNRKNIIIQNSSIKNKDAITGLILIVFVAVFIMILRRKRNS